MIILDIKKDQEDDNKRYDIKYRDDNIDFRRVGSQKVFFDSYAEKLPSGLDDLISYQPGDIVVFDGTEHIAMISDKRNKNAIPYLIQNGDEEQEEKEEDRGKENRVKPCRGRCSSSPPAYGRCLAQKNRCSTEACAAAAFCFSSFL